MTREEAKRLVLQKLRDAGFPDLHEDDALTDALMLDERALVHLAPLLSPSEDADGEEVPLLLDARFLEAHERVISNGATVAHLIELVRIRFEIVDAYRSRQSE